jgi:hypothetical protein
VLQKRSLHRIKANSYEKGSVGLPETKGKSAASQGSQAFPSPDYGREQNCSHSGVVMTALQTAICLLAWGWLCSTNMTEGVFLTFCLVQVRQKRWVNSCFRIQF